MEILMPLIDSDFFKEIIMHSWWTVGWDCIQIPKDSCSMYKRV